MTHMKLSSPLIRAEGVDPHLYCDELNDLKLAFRPKQYRYRSKKRPLRVSAYVSCHLSIVDPNARIVYRNPEGLRFVAGYSCNDQLGFLRRADVFHIAS
jgi:hypothetical protein